MRRRNKRGQFYLVAAMIIIVVILGIWTTRNYVRSSDSVRIADVKDELLIEGAKVIEHDAINGGDNLDDFMEDYSAYVGGDMEIYYVFGTAGSIEAYKYVNGVGTPVTVTEGTGTAEIEVGEETYEVEINSGTNFHFVVLQEIGDEKYIEIG